MDWQPTGIQIVTSCAAFKTHQGAPHFSFIQLKIFEVLNSVRWQNHLPHTDLSHLRKLGLWLHEFFLIFEIVPFSVLWKSCENHSTHSLYQHSILLMNFLSCSICGDISQNAISNGILYIFSPLVSLTTLWAFLWMCFHSNFFFIILANRYIKPAREQPTVVSFSFSGNNRTWKITILSLLPNLWYRQGRV